MIGPGLTLALALLLTGPQSLGEAAKKEKERRAKEKDPARVFTEDDLGPRGPNASPSPTVSPSPSPTPARSPSPSPPPEDESEARRKSEQEWRARFAQARERVAQAEDAAWRTVLEVDFVAGIPIQRYVRKFEETEDLRQARKALEELEDELRRAGLPAGWGRD